MRFIEVETRNGKTLVNTDNVYAIYRCEGRTVVETLRERIIVREDYKVVKEKIGSVMKRGGCTDE